MLFYISGDIVGAVYHQLRIDYYVTLLLLLRVLAVLGLYATLKSIRSSSS